MSTLPEKSRAKYESTFLRFEKWYDENNMQNIDETTLLTYFEEKAKIQKSSSLWAQYSMLKAVLSVKRNIDISNYKTLLAFLKTKAVGYQPAKPNVLNQNHIETFLREADDDTYLLMKVVMIVGIAGSCKREELVYMLADDVKDEGQFFRMKIPTSERDFIILGERDYDLVGIIRKYIQLRPKHLEQKRFFLAYRNGKCVNQPVGKNTIGIIPKKIASFLGLPQPESYHGYRIKKSSHNSDWPSHVYTGAF